MDNRASLDYRAQRGVFHASLQRQSRVNLYKRIIIATTLTQFAIQTQVRPYVTTKMYVVSTCGCNNNTIFSEIAIFTFLTFDVEGSMPDILAPQRQRLGDAVKLARWRH